MIEHKRFSILLGLLWTLSASTVFAALTPSQASMPGVAVSLRAETINLTLADAVYNTATPSGGAVCTAKVTSTNISTYAWSVEFTMK